MKCSRWLILVSCLAILGLLYSSLDQISSSNRKVCLEFANLLHIQYCYEKLFLPVTIFFP
ncbi:hypothetical protein BpHYR1_048280 [Brachionus plicatilis]|uniref:Uncharacterized protein n=1 Tax=Brachionus plicatilis TaxID=10195 RepID=A0A3M7QCZ9_BRAPC|nr:hypothetical protein BpHYR1_048280 [Brachionus plicatilis]